MSRYTRGISTRLRLACYIEREAAVGVYSTFAENTLSRTRAFHDLTPTRVEIGIVSLWSNYLVSLMYDSVEADPDSSLACVLVSAALLNLPLDRGLKTNEVRYKDCGVGLWCFEQG